jgi:hypothetical protein
VSGEQLQPPVASSPEWKSVDPPKAWLARCTNLKGVRMWTGCCLNHIWLPYLMMCSPDLFTWEPCTIVPDFCNVGVSDN